MNYTSNVIFGFERNCHHGTIIKHKEGDYMLRIGICDDSKEASFTTYFGLEKILENRNIEYVIYEFSSGEKFIEWHKKNKNEIDLLFLDIEMPGLNGMETAKLIREENDYLQIVFLTSHPDFVFDGYSVNALGYLLKPAKEEDLNKIITRTLLNLDKNEEEVFTCKNIDGIYRIPKKDILYFYSKARKVICVTRENNYEFYEKLNNIEESIKGNFVRIHQRYLVNSKAVRQIKSDTVLVDNIELPVSRTYQDKAVIELSRNLLN
ncbi:MAG: LytTR family DNA-binding domain-containing protein [Miniphocaeibacter sp.]|uniref:LytR/AlgR family response regulator transcription factor n=1 Tax=Miniphocaeibacter sp. TaxID=3100973 RepID=UPI003BAE38B4